MRDPFARLDDIENLGGFVVAVRRYKYGYVLAQYLAGLVTIQRFRALVPTRDRPVERFADNRVLGRGHDGGQKSAFFFRFTALGNVLLDTDVALDAPTRAAHRRNGHFLPVQRAVSTPVDQLAGPGAALCN